MARLVTDPAGEPEPWRVKRRWLPWRLRRRDPEDFLDGGPGDAFAADDLLVGVVIFVVVVIVVVFVPVVLVAAILVAELLILLLLLPFFLMLRTLLVARWPLEVWRGDVLVHAEAVRGWTASKARIGELEQRIQHGNPPLPARRHRRSDSDD